MPALVCLSPVLADQSFPRYAEELKIVAVALGKLAELAAQHRVQIVQTKIFRELLEAFSWKPPHQLKRDIRQHLSNWFLTGGSQTIRIDVSDISEYELHPLPQGSGGDGFQELWAEDIGRLLRKHDAFTRGAGYFIGVACEHAFAKNRLSTYMPHSCARFFPLVGPDTCDCTSATSVLEDAWDFDVPGWAATIDITFNEAYKNVYAIGASAVRPPSSGSHYIIQFPRGRSWVLDKNYRVVPPNYLAELTHITGYPIAAIKYALRTGNLPERRLRIT